MEKYFWFSFSYRGKNNGVCLIKADSPKEADDKLHELGITPDFDDVQIFEIDTPEIELNVLISSEDMVTRGYATHTTTICKDCNHEN